MRVLITGGAGFIGGNVAVGLARRHAELGAGGARQPPPPGRRAEPAAPARRGRALPARRCPRARRPARRWASSTRSSSARPSLRRSRASMEVPITSMQSNLVGAYHCLELARRRGAYMVFLSTSRVYPVAALERARARGDRHALRAGRRAACSRRVAGRDRRGFPARRGPHALRLDQARGRAADRGVPGGVRLARGDRPLRRDRRAVADGQGRSGRVHLLDARPPLPPAAAPTSASAGTGKQVRDLLHVEDLLDLLDEQLAEPRALGRGHGQRRRRPRLQPLAAGDDRAVRRDHGRIG